ncbi:MAG: glycosyltransferase family 2 protein [Myxococcales bacterium]|nr:glycosyltransferase family 2 protein [Myxococcales bacterium]
MILGCVLLTLSLVWLGFGYAGYPLLALLLARWSPRRVLAGDSQPSLSVIIAVYNGEQKLLRKLEATLALEYPSPIEVIVASDGSTDGTDLITREFADRGVTLIRSEGRRGKEAAQANAIQHASGEILVFTDVGAELEPDALRQIVRPFCDPNVGCVSSEDIVDSSGGERSYVSLEMWLRRLETRTSTLVGLSGSFFAVRRSLASPWPEDLASDFRCALESIRRGYRAVSEPRAGARFQATEDHGIEWQRKIRTVRRGIAVLAAYRELLHPRFGRAALALWGHKVARFTSPFALLGILAGSALAAAESGLAATLLIAQLLVYALGVLALTVREVGAHSIPRLAGFFLLVNAAILVAWVYHLSGRRAVMWQPTQR